MTRSILLLALLCGCTVAFAENDRIGVGVELSQADRDAYRRDADERVASIDSRLNALDKQMSTASSGVRRELLSAKKDIQAQRRSLDRELTSLRRSSDRSWRRQRVQVDAVFQRIEKSFSRLGDELEIAEFGVAIKDKPITQQKVESIEAKVDALSNRQSALEDRLANIEDILKRIERAVTAPRPPAE